MKYEYKGYIIKVTTWGDSTTTIYRYRLMQPKKWGIFKYNSLLWMEDVHRDRMGNKISDRFDWLIEQYEKEEIRWEV